MQLWRIDATFDAEDSDDDLGRGAWTLLYRSQPAAQMNAAAYSSLGIWLIDVYAEEVARNVSPQTIDRVCNRLWPQLPIGELLALAEGSKLSVQEQLDCIRKRKSQEAI